MSLQDSLFLGVDIGGTKVAAGLVNREGEIIHKVRCPMSTGGSPDDALASVAEAVEMALRESRCTPSGVGLSAPGPLDPRSGVVINPPNLPCWRNYPLVEEIKKLFRLPVQLDNDANAAGLAEALWGAGRGHQNVFYATIGTGIGTGIILNGRVHLGRTGAAGEGGHNTIDYKGPQCGCGKLGCIEALASGTAIARRAKEAVRLADRESSAALVACAGGDSDKLTCEAVAKAWMLGDPLATVILSETSDLLAIWLGNVIDMLEPDVIVIGGGVGELISAWFPEILRKLPRWSINQRCTEIPLVLARYGADSGVAGGAALCLSNNDSLPQR